MVTPVMGDTGAIEGSSSRCSNRRRAPACSSALVYCGDAANALMMRVAGSRDDGSFCDAGEPSNPVGEIERVSRSHALQANTRDAPSMCIMPPASLSSRSATAASARSDGVARAPAGATSDARVVSAARCVRSSPIMDEDCIRAWRRAGAAPPRRNAAVSFGNAASVVTKCTATPATRTSAQRSRLAQADAPPELPIASAMRAASNGASASVLLPTVPFRAVTIW